MAEHERRDAVIEGLAGLGAIEPVRADDLVRAEATLRDFHRARRSAQGARIGRVVGWTGGVAAMAAALVLGWWTLPRGQELPIEVTSGAFVLQQDRLDAGARVPVETWIEITEGRACLRVAMRQACGEPGTRLRIRDDGALELERGRVRVEDGLALRTPLGELVGATPALEIEIVPEAGTITVHEGSATVGERRLDVGIHPLDVAAPSEPAVVAIGAAPIDRTPPVLPDDEPTITDDAAAPSVSVRRAMSPRTEARVEPGAGEMLAAARALASAGKLEPAARAYQKLIESHPASSESRAALVSLGRVQASRGRHGAALAAFEAYLERGGGALAEEAHWGRVSALHALGRVPQRDRAIEALASAHPRSVYLAKARKLALSVER